VVYGAGKGNMQDKAKLGTILYNRGVSAAVLSVEALRGAQEKYGKGKPVNGEQVRWAMENLDITDARLKEIGATDLLPPIKTSCANHEGSGMVKIQQWDGAKWMPVSGWIEGDKASDPPAVQGVRPAVRQGKGHHAARLRERILTVKPGRWPQTPRFIEPAPMTAATAATAPTEPRRRPNAI
jgi:branched-chain amino acid transport system substrate-binding protein